MSESAFWAHGTSLITETQDHVSADGRYGWGADVSVLPGKDCWFHMPIPIGIPGDVAGVEVRAIYVKFYAAIGDLRSLHVYDGSTKVHEFSKLHREGDFRRELTTENTFTLPGPHALQSGLGISLGFTAAIDFDSRIPPSRFIVSAAGAQVLLEEELRLPRPVKIPGEVICW